MNLGKRIVICVGALAVATSVARAFSPDVVRWFALQLPEHHRQTEVLPVLGPITVLSVPDAIELGLALSLPVIASQLLVGPGGAFLTAAKRRRQLIALSLLLDPIGIVVAYYAIIPTVLAHRFRVDPPSVFQPQLQTLVQICCEVVLLTAVAFQTPLVLIGLRDQPHLQHDSSDPDVPERASRAAPDPR